MIGTVALAAALAAAAVAVAVAVRRPSGAPRVLRWAALALSVAVAALLTPFTVGDSGAAAGYLLGVPVLGAAIPALSDLAGRPRLVADAAGAAVVSGWGLLLAAGVGAAFLPAGLLLLLALATRAATRASRPGA
ncbi:MAG TPA: hypothetical protein VNV66_18460 [Pilimelia sp.]|nr:hypothetical protein [Pilimelia sp.]